MASTALFSVVTAFFCNRFWLRMHQHHGQRFCGYVQLLCKNIHAHTHLILCVQRRFHSQFFSKVVCTSDEREWALVRILSFADERNLLCPMTGAPVVVINEDADILAFPITAVQSCVSIIQIPQGEEDDAKEHFWINWWITSGPYYYNEDARFDFLVQHQLLLE